LTVNGWKVSFIPYYMISKMKWSAPDTGEAIRVLGAEGFDGVEWMLGHHFNSVRELTALVQKTRSRRLQVSNIMCWQDFVIKDETSRKRRVAVIEKYIRVASALEIPILNVFTGPMTWNPDHEKVGRDISEERAWNAVKESFSNIVESAEKNNVVITVEAVFGMLVHDYYTMNELLSYFHSENLAVNLDPSHLALYGNDPAWAISRLGSKVKHVHVKDAAGKAGVLGEDFNFPFLGEGIVQWRSFFDALRSVGYSGFLSLEFENDSYLTNVCDGDWQIAARESKKRLAKFLKA
jgi:sugar phosphate isomerase/epimerase